MLDQIPRLCFSGLTEGGGFNPWSGWLIKSLPNE